MKRKICFLTGTRADFGKLKPLMQAVDTAPDFECLIFATGMHMLTRYGLTVDEIYKAGFRTVHGFMNHVHGEPMELILANTISGLSRYLHESEPDLFLVHGDRVEALAGAIVGALRNVRVAHIEGGEVSGTVDELLRHAITKLAHLHFVANESARGRIIQLGENPRSVYVIGSPEVDVMLSPRLPSLEEVQRYYEIPFERYAIGIFHPVTTEPEPQSERARNFAAALVESEDNFVLIHPNNDQGSDAIFEAYDQFRGNARFRMFPSMRFEYFLTLLRHARYIVGNSSTGVREAPVYAVPSVNVGNREINRLRHESIVDVGNEKGEIIRGIAKALALDGLAPCHHFGDGKSTVRFMETIRGEEFWRTPIQKQFRDVPLAPARA